jgi:hypothetical protein
LQAGGLELVQDLLNVFPVFVYRTNSENQNIVNIRGNKVIKMFAKNPVYKLLKRGWGIG